jgi:Flp pilus assembly protein TadB/Mg-chelatase subunit ChlD
MALPFAAALTQLGSVAMAMPSNGQNDATITDIQTQPGVVQFVLSVGNLPSGSTLDPSSIAVTAGQQTLHSRATVGGQKSDAKAAAPVRVAVLALDVSGSMAGDGITSARAAAISYARSLPPDVRVGLVTFSNTTTVLLRPTIDRAALVSAVAKVRAGGNTSLYDGVLEAVHAMGGLPADADRRLLILSDGQDTSSRHSLQDVTSELGGDGIAADVVAFRLPGSQAALKTIAIRSHGQVLPAGNAADLAGIFTKAAQAFRQRLLVTVQVPPALANKRTTLSASANAGSGSIFASTSIVMPDAASGSSAGGSSLRISSPPASASKTQLKLVLAAVFLAIFVAMLAALFLPTMRRGQAQRQSRLAEMQRYRVLGAVGTQTWNYGPGIYQPSGQTALAERALSVVDRTVRARGQRERIVSELERAGLRMRPEEWAVIQLASILVTAVVLLVLTGSFIGFVVGVVFGWGGARLFIKAKISRRQTAFMDQLPDTLQLMASSLRSGFSLNQALGGVVREGSEPAASEFARALTEVRVGAELEQALDDVAERMKCEDLGWVVMAIRISREVGGNLAEVLGTTVQTMRQRADLRGQVRVLSAEGRLSARILTALPFLIAAVLALLKPGYMTPLFTQPQGIAMLAVGAVLLTVGTFWLSRIVKIKV